MAEMVKNTEANTEFWRPPAEELHRSSRTALEVEVCDRCQSEFVMGSRFCHVCGLDRLPHTYSRAHEMITAVGHALDFNRMRNACGLNTAAFIAFLVGIFCLLATLLIGAIYNVKTVLDWQAVQIWRVQWLIAALMAFAAGILLRQKD